MAQEIKYSEDFTGADGTLPAEWSKIEFGADVGIQNDQLDLNNAGSFAGDGLAIQDDINGYQFSKSTDWDLRFDALITGMDDDTKYIEFRLTAGSEKIGFIFSKSGSLNILTVVPGAEEPPHEITIPSYPTKIRFRNISGTLFLDYDIGGGYEFDGGAAYSTEMEPAVFYSFSVFLGSDSFVSTSELRVTLDNYIVLGDVIIISDFWHNHTLQTEKDNLPGEGSLAKLSTVKIIKSVGQPYVPPTEATGPKSSASSGINYVCERVI